jgi:hypothetical protein
MRWDECAFPSEGFQGKASLILKIPILARILL